MDIQNISIKVIIKPILKIQNPSDTFLFEAEMERIVVVNSDTLIKNVCSEIMNKVGLNHLVSNSQAYIQFPGPKYFTFESFFPNLEVNIGIVKSLFGDALLLRISPIGDAKDFSEVDMKQTVCSNVLKLLLKKYPSIKQYIDNPAIHDIIESLNPSSDIKIPYHSLFKLNQTIEEEITSINNNENKLSLVLTNNPTTIDQPLTPVSLVGDTNSPEDINTSNSSQSPEQKSYTIDDNDSLIKSFFQSIPQTQNIMIRNIFTPPTKQHYYSRCRVSFDPIKETPILERWYQTVKTPTFFQLQQYANHLNELSNRTTNAKITSHNVKIWFKNRRAKENRVSKLLETKK